MEFRPAPAGSLTYHHASGLPPRLCANTPLNSEITFLLMGARENDRTHKSQGLPFFSQTRTHEKLRRPEVPRRKLCAQRNWSIHHPSSFKKKPAAYLLVTFIPSTSTRIVAAASSRIPRRRLRSRRSSRCGPTHAAVIAVVVMARRVIMSQRISSVVFSNTILFVDIFFQFASG